MEKRTTGIIAVVATALLCGCPGLSSLCWGVTSAAVSFMPGAEIDVFGSSDPNMAFAYGLGGICLGIIGLAIPIVLGVTMLRRKPETAMMDADINIPPAA